MYGSLSCFCGDYTVVGNLENRFLETGEIWKLAIFIQQVLGK